jgi:hypothetical protein
MENCVSLPLIHAHPDRTNIVDAERNNGYATVMKPNELIKNKDYDQTKDNCGTNSDSKANYLDQMIGKNGIASFELGECFDLWPLNVSNTP